MKKFLLILLIALAASATIQLDTGDLKFSWDWAKKIIEFVKKLTGKLLDLYHWLKDNGYWDQIIELLKKYGKPKAIELCTQVFKNEGVCTDLIDLLFSFIK